MLKIVALVLVASVGMASEARADVVFQFTTTSYGTNVPGLPGIPLTMTFDLPDPSGSGGSFGISGRNGLVDGSNPDYGGNPGQFSLIIQGAVITPTHLFGRISASLAFDASDIVTSSSVAFFGESEEVQVSGTGSTASGFVGSDQRACNSSAASQTCFVTGSWHQVPEPATAALFGSGLLALAWRRRSAV